MTAKKYRLSFVATHESGYKLQRDGCNDRTPYEVVIAVSEGPNKPDEADEVWNPIGSMSIRWSRYHHAHDPEPRLEILHGYWWMLTLPELQPIFEKTANLRWHGGRPQPVDVMDFLQSLGAKDETVREIPEHALDDYHHRRIEHGGLIYAPVAVVRGSGGPDGR